jgi:uncharacterized membrane protein
MQKAVSGDLYRGLGAACGVVLLALLGASFLLFRGLPVYQVVSFTLFGICLSVLLGFAINLGLEDSRRYGSHSH